MNEKNFERADESAWFPIRTVASLTGVKPVTLRAWERRHQLLRPRRTDKGHRLYSRDDIDRITRLQGLLEQGIPVSQAAIMLAEKPGGSRIAQLDIWARARKRCQRAISNFSEPELEAVIDEVHSLYPVQTVTRELLIPLMAELGRGWEETGAGIAEEHFFSVFLRSKLGARFHHRVRRNQGQTIVVAGMPGELHETGMLFFALAATVDFKLVLLGSNLPLAHLVIPVQRTAADGIVLSSAVMPGPGVLERDLVTLVKQARVPVFVGGLVSVQCRDAIIRAAAIPLGEDIDRGMRIIREKLNSQP